MVPVSSWNFSSLPLTRIVGKTLLGKSVPHSQPQPHLRHTPHRCLHVQFNMMYPGFGFTRNCKMIFLAVHSVYKSAAPGQIPSVILFGACCLSQNLQWSMVPLVLGGLSPKGNPFFFPLFFCLLICYLLVYLPHILLQTYVL